MSTQLERIAQKARAERKLRFTALAHHLTPEFFRETWRLMNRRSASGIDGETAREFERDLDRRIPELVARLKAESIKLLLFAAWRSRSRVAINGDLSGFPPRRTGCCSEPWRGFSKRSTKRTSWMCPTDIGPGVIRTRP